MALSVISSPRARICAVSPIVAQQLTDFAVVVGPVQAQALRSFALRLGTLDRDRVKRCLQQLVIVAVRAGVIEPDRDPCGVREDRAFRPLICAVR